MKLKVWIAQAKFEMSVIALFSYVIYILWAQTLPQNKEGLEINSYLFCWYWRGKCNILDFGHIKIWTFKQNRENWMRKNVFSYGLWKIRVFKWIHHFQSLENLWKNERIICRRVGAKGKVVTQRRRGIMILHWKHWENHLCMA
jgi:hypothetical protein